MFQSNNTLNNEAEFTITLINEDSNDSKISDDFIKRVESSFDMTESETNDILPIQTNHHSVNNRDYEKYINKVQINTNFAKSLDFEQSSSSYIELPQESLSNRQTDSDFKQNQIQINSNYPQCIDNNSPRFSSLTNLSDSKNKISDDSYEPILLHDKLNLYSYEIINSFETNVLLEKYSKKLMKVSLKIEIKSFLKEFVKNYINDLQINKQKSSELIQPLSIELKPELTSSMVKTFDDVLIIDSDNYNEQLDYKSYVESYQPIQQSVKHDEISHHMDNETDYKTHRAVGTSPINFLDNDIESIVSSTNKNIFRSFNCISRQTSSSNDTKSKVQNRKYKSQSNSLLFRLFNRQKTKSKDSSPAYFTKTYTKDHQSDINAKDSTISNSDSISNVWSENGLIDCNKSFDSFHRPSSGYDRVKSCPTPHINHSTNSEMYNQFINSNSESNNAVFVIE